MTSTDKWGTALWVGQGDAVQCITDALTFSNGGSVLNADFTECVLDQQAAIEAMKYFKKLQEINPREKSVVPKRFFPTFYCWKGWYVLVWRMGSRQRKCPCS